MGDTSAIKSSLHRTFALTRRYGGWVVIIAAVGFGFMHLREFHHPAYGFTRLLQISPSWSEKAVPEVRTTNTYIYREEAGYDGQFYAQLALRPALQDPTLDTAIDLPSMRARRILTSWIAAGVGVGDAFRTLNGYAWLNVVAWVALGIGLLRLLPPTSLHHIVAWIGLMFSAGVTTSVVYALTDLPALLLILLGMFALRHQRGKTTAGLFAAACLSRETSLLAGLTLLQLPTWRERVLRGLIIVTPVALWFVYVSFRFPATGNSLQNFAIPFTALAGKLHTTFAALVAAPADALAWAGLGGILAILVQAGWLVARPQPRNPWWQLGIGYVGLLAILGAPTFAGYPAAVTRILLPLHLAFIMLTPRTRAGLVLLLVGNLSVFTGGYMLSRSDINTKELNHVIQARGPVVLEIGDGWNGVERDDIHTWSWCGGEGRLLVRQFNEDGVTDPVNLVFTLVGELGCDVTITQNGNTLWEGYTEKPGVTVHLEGIELDHTGRTGLDFYTAGPSHLEAGTGRRLAFAVYNVRIY